MNKAKVEKQNNYDITVFGEILIDFTEQGENEDGRSLFAQNPGGAPANVAVAAKRLGANTAFLGKAGDDMHGEFLMEVLRSEGVDTTGMVLDENYFTTLAFVAISPTGERTFSFSRKPGADTMIEASEIDLSVLEHTNIFHVGSLSLTTQPARGTTFYAVDRARERGSIISYDPNYRASLWESPEIAMEHMRSMIPYVDIIKISDEETVLLTGHRDVESAAKELYGRGISLVLITTGADGAYVYCKDGGRTVPGFKSDVIDTNGAGDSFFGGVLYRLSRSGKRPEDLTLDELAEYAEFGNAVASICVEGKGAMPAMPHLHEVEERLLTLKKD